MRDFLLTANTGPAAMHPAFVIIPRLGVLAEHYGVHASAEQIDGRSVFSVSGIAADADEVAAIRSDMLAIIDDPAATIVTLSVAAR